MWFFPLHSDRPKRLSPDACSKRECSTSPFLSVVAFSPLGVRKSKLRLFLRGCLDRLELTVDKPPHGALSVSLDSHQQARRPGCGFVMWIRSGFQVFKYP